MKVLFLGPADSPLIGYLLSQGETVLAVQAPVDVDLIARNAPEFIVSHGYRRILRRDVLARFPGRAVNLHISYLPWNRGADPNFWSFVDDTPKGVTIHHMDEGVDTGDIILQRLVEMREDDTLRTSYERLQRTLHELFQDNWRAIRTGACPRKKQQGEGSSHRLKEKDRLAHLLTADWDTPVAKLRRVAPK